MYVNIRVKKEIAIIILKVFDDIISGLKLDPSGNLDSVISLRTIFKITDKYSKFYGGEIDGNFTEDEEKIVGYFILLRYLRGRFLLHYYKMKL